MRVDGRKPDELRPIIFQRGFTRYAEGSVLVCYGETKVLCNASLVDKVPFHVKEERPGEGWITAEYALLPRSTHDRTTREAVAGKISGRTHEIQRLIGRSLRMAVDLRSLGERTITIDCDVLQADGGTRTAAITGAWLALHDAIGWLKAKRAIQVMPKIEQLAAVSVGIWRGESLLDLCYEEDKEAGVDANIVMMGNGRFIEVGFTSEGRAFDKTELDQLLELARSGIRQIFQLQREAISSPLPV
ncbi:MAG: ribonuclease PH [Cyanobacteria bacterium NC_groundwater_1444_Ag_S-0.65um_54_12]|nr:ribonuclease PH [Cyanobacteria bacterium NC_groundwater_1444_Ag_S-0.65um_54_12]